MKQILTVSFLYIAAIAITRTNYYVDALSEDDQNEGKNPFAAIQNIENDQ